MDDEIVEEGVIEEEEEATCDTCLDPEDCCSCIICSYCGDKNTSGYYCNVCEDACSGCCSCCQECGYTECVCCEYCGGDGCDCGEAMGYSTRTPWEERGIKVAGSANNSTANWRSIWPEIDSKNFDLCQQAADFYLLEAITNGIVNCDDPVWLMESHKVATKDMLYILIGVKDERTKDRLLLLHKDTAHAKANPPKPLEVTLRGIIKDAKTLYDARIENADSILRAYFHMAVAGEARHHRSLKGRILSTNRDQAWSGWRSIYDEVGPEALMDLATLFMEFEDGAYGGTPWAEACRILHSREMGTLGPNDQMNKKMFIDRAWTLEHNGGCFLNKIEWDISNRMGWHMEKLKTKVLEAHAANPTNYRVLLKVASDEVLALWDQVWDIQNELRGEFRENPRTAVGQMRVVCISCKSNALLGHYANCKIRTSSRYNEAPPSDTTPQPWYNLLDVDDWDEIGYRHDRWRDDSEGLWWGPNFEILNPNQKIKIYQSMNLSAYVESKIPGDQADYGSRKSFNQYYGGYNWSKSLSVKACDLDGMTIDPQAYIKSLKDKLYVKIVNDFNREWSPKDKIYNKENLRIVITSATFEWSHDFNSGYTVIAEPFNSKVKNKSQPIVLTGAPA